MKERVTHKQESTGLSVNAAALSWVHWLVIGASFLLTIAAWYISKKQVEQNIDARFNREAIQLVELVKERMALYENVLLGAAAMVDSRDGNIDYPQWLKYANSLRIDLYYPGINGIGIIYNIKPQDLSEFLTRERAHRPDFKIHPAHSQIENWPITYIEPQQSNLPAVGLDMAFESNRYQALKSARDLAETQLTGPIILVQDDKKTPGFLFFAPFYRNGNKPVTIESRREQIIGATYAPFIMKKLMQGTLSTNNRQLSLTIKDRGVLLYQDQDTEIATYQKHFATYVRNIQVDMYGRHWDFSIASTHLFDKASKNYQPLFILLGGLIIDCLLIVLFLFMSGAKKQAEAISFQLKTKTKKLESSNKDLEEFAHVASHDLKSPLNAIQKLASWIVEDCGDILPKKSQEHLKLLEQRCDRLTKLLNDLLNYSRVGRSREQVEKVDLKEISEDVFLLLENNENFALTVESGDIFVPRAPFEIVLRNLISNAIKHHHKSCGKIFVGNKTSQYYYHIKVSDDGPGIPQDLQEKALEMFQTLRPRDDVEGSGMGLSLVKRIVEHYGGNVRVQSDGKSGTTIEIIWPKE